MKIRILNKSFRILEGQEERGKKENPHHFAELFVDSKGTLIY